MSQEPSWDDIFRPSGTPPEPGTGAADPIAGQPASRRALREAEAQHRGAGEGRGGRGRPPRRRRLGWLWALVVVLALVAAGATTVWVLFEDRVREVLGWELPNDYEGSGNGTEVLVTIASGEIGSDVAQTLVDSGVTMTYEAFYELLLAQEVEPVFTPGTYALQEEMSAQAALDILRDPDNIVVNTVGIREGVTLATIVEELAAGTGIAVEEFEAAIDEGPEAYGASAEAPSLEGYLFPATYRFDPGLGAHEIVQTMVDRMFESLDTAGVAPEDRHEILTIASLLQREARLEDDFYRVSRVIQNRLAEGMMLQFDSTSHYGAGETGSVWSSPESRADENDYNTYAKTGLPIGPIAAPGDLAIRAALDPAEGSWLYFVTVDLRTGETVFTDTLTEHEAAAQELFAWCRDPGNAELCE